MNNARQKYFAGGGNYVYQLDVSSPRTALDIRAAAVSAGWDQVRALTAIINITAAGAIYSTSSTAAVTYTGAIPSNSLIIIRNAGIIYGAPGAGGTGTSTALSTVPFGGTNATAGSTAIQTTVAMTIDNTGGIIAGGAGGGGAGGGGWKSTAPQSGGGGGGGGGGATYSGLGSGGAGGTGGTSFGSTWVDSSPGSAGTTTGGVGGFGGVGKDGGGATTSAGGTGGAGGTPGTAGANGTAGIIADVTTGGTNGGAAGNYIDGNAFVTWLATGTRLGGVA